MTRIVMIGLVALSLAGAGWRVSSGAFTESLKSSEGAQSAADARQKEILRENLGRPSDPALARRFAELNAKHFAQALPAMPVIWEPRLAEVGALAGPNVTLLGVFGQSGDRSAILLDPSLKNDAEGLDRALCHEMVHAYLFTTLGDSTTNHGESFQAVLRRLSSEGAFVGIPASAQERADLRAWLDTEKARLDAEHKAIAGVRDPAEFSSRSALFYTAQDEFNRQVARYNLMVSYPDGMN